MTSAITVQNGLRNKSTNYYFQRESFTFKITVKSGIQMQKRNCKTAILQRMWDVAPQHMLSVWLKYNQIALAGVAQWLECHPENQGVTGSIPSQGTCLGYGARSPVGGMHKRQPHIDISFPVFLPPFPFL